MLRMLFCGLCVCCLTTLISGCGQAGNQASQANAKQTAEHSADKAGDDHDHSAHGHDHSGWWCTVHGVPEDVCALCNRKVAAEMKKKGDWCKEHERPDSQCFKCHPELEAKFAALYEAKYGKQPPKPKIN